MGSGDESDDRPDESPVNDEFTSDSVERDSDFDLPDLKRPSAWGVYLAWPEEGTDWIHPDDIDTCSRLIPGHRVFRREQYDETYYLLTYADDYLRVKPSLWLEISFDGYAVGDQVEIRSKMGKHLPQIAVIAGMLWNPKRRFVEFELRSGDSDKNLGLFVAEDFQPAMRLDEHMDERKRKLIARSRLQ